ncbi:MAG TPA: hypothetical protein VJT83_06835 [Chitinophagaceae bacterium]|nr:hypothetical protein [Chitinophagaceae bacterium]
MEHLSSLIHKLKEQFEQNVPAEQMMTTVRQIESALSARSTSSAEKEIVSPRSSGKVAVMMPAGMKSMVAREITEQHVKYAPAVAVAEVETEVLTKSPEKNGHSHPKKAEQSGWLFDPMEEIPTLAHQHSQELNDIIGNVGTSLNDHLREERTEVAHKLTDTPIRDLKKGIGVNDRFVFLNELFRGDEAMYERSLKTINGFRILPEAEYWINRELKIKLGWIDDQPTVRHFYQLVRRRFS